MDKANDIVGDISEKIFLFDHVFQHFIKDFRSILTGLVLLPWQLLCMAPNEKYWISYHVQYMCIHIPSVLNRYRQC